MNNISGWHIAYACIWRGSQLLLTSYFFFLSSFLLSHLRFISTSTAKVFVRFYFMLMGLEPRGFVQWAWMKNCAREFRLDRIRQWKSEIIIIRANTQAIRVLASKMLLLLPALDNAHFHAPPIDSHFLFSVFLTPSYIIKLINAWPLFR